MQRPWLIIVLLILLGRGNYLTAQIWTKTDSAWLQDILSGKDLLRLNPETREAIRSGTLIHTRRPDSGMQPVRAKMLSILKDFSEYIRSDSAGLREIILKNLPPGVFRLYAPPPLLETTVYQNMLDAWKRSPFYHYRPAATATFDMGELTSRKAHIHKRNARRDSIWRNYPYLLPPHRTDSRQQTGD